MSEPRGAVVAGHICLDVIPDLDALPEGSFYESFRPGRLIEVGAAELSTGGPVSNAGLALHILGIPTRLVGKVGADSFGRVVREIVDSYGAGLATGIKVDASTSTPYSVIVSPPGVDRLFLHHPGAASTFGLDDVDFDELDEAALFHFGYPPLMRRMYRDGGRELVELFERVRTSGITTSLDLSYPDPVSDSGRASWRQILSAVLPFVDVFAPSAEELLFMMRRELFEELSARESVASQVTPALLHELGEELIALGVGVAAIKLGERGLYLITGTRERIGALGRAHPSDPDSWADLECWAPCFRVKVAGTTGAGDATIAGLLAALLRDLSAEEALTSAVAVGACNVERADALSGLRGWEETLQRARSGWEQLPLELDDSAWHWDTRHHHWVRRPQGELSR
ncbi:MAG: carbohydrate kinase family protein [Gaiellaceae bacterium]